MLPLLQQLPLEEFIELDVFQSPSWTDSLETLVDGAVTFRNQTSKNIAVIQPLRALTFPSSLKNSFITLDCLSTLAEEAIRLEYLAMPFH
jgi:UDP-N-acetylglucosamine 2-epimerase